MKPEVFGRVIVGLVEPRRGRAQGTVDEPLEAAPPEHVVTASVLGDVVAQALPSRRSAPPSRPAGATRPAPLRAGRWPGPPSVPMSPTWVTPVRQGVAGPPPEGPVQLLLGGFGNGRVHEVHGLVLEDTRRLSRFRVPHDGPARGIGGASTASTPAARSAAAVGQGHVAVQPVHEHGVVRREGIHPLLAGQLATPQLMVPVSALDPRARRNGLRERADAASELFGGGRVPQVDARELEAAVDEVGVGVDEARGERAPIQLHHARVASDGGVDLIVGAHGQNPSILHGHGLHHAQTLDSGPHLPAAEYQIGGFPVGHAAGRKKCQRHCQRESSRAHTLLHSSGPCGQMRRL